VENTTHLDTVLEQLNPYLLDLVRRKIPRQVVAEGQLDLEIDEIAQRVRIKLWQALRREDVHNPKAYIRSVVRTECVDFLRRSLKTTPLLQKENGEYYHEDVPDLSAEMLDPADILEREEAGVMASERLLRAVFALPPRQKQAMVSFLLSQLASVPQLDIPQVVDVLKRLQGSAEVYSQEKSDRQRFAAILSIARKKVRKSMILQPGEQKVNACINAPLEPEDTGKWRLQSENFQQVIVDALVEQLPEPYRTAVRLHYVEKLTYRQISERLRLPLGTIKSHVSRGMKLLETLKKQGPQRSVSYYPSKQNVLASLDLLNEPYRTAVQLRYVENLSCQQIAERLQLPLGTIKSQISRGMKKLHFSA
jgi:RNA polymerase sigma factor (sigma-70 family)